MPDTIELPALEAIQGAVLNHVAMLTVDDKQLYFAVAKDLYEFRGAIVDLGVFLGSTAVALVMGALQNKRCNFPKQPRVASFDLFELDHAGVKIVEWYAERSPDWQPFASPKERADTTALIKSLLGGFIGFIELYKGDIREAKYRGDPIEILSIDICKSRDITDAAFREFLPKLIDGAYILQQDFIHPWHPYLHTAVGYFADHFGVIHENDDGATVLYRLLRPITEDQMAGFSETCLRDRSSWLALWDRAYEQIKTSRARASLQTARVLLIAEIHGFAAAEEVAARVERHHSLSERDRVWMSEVLTYSKERFGTPSAAATFLGR